MGDCEREALLTTETSAVHHGHVTAMGAADPLGRTENGVTANLPVRTNHASSQGEPRQFAPALNFAATTNRCPACRVGILKDVYTCPGICCALLLFPIGIILCLALREQRCLSCGAVFS